MSATKQIVKELPDGVINYYGDKPLIESAIHIVGFRQREISRKVLESCVIDLYENGSAHFELTLLIDQQDLKNSKSDRNCYQTKITQIKEPYIPADCLLIIRYTDVLTWWRISLPFIQVKPWEGITTDNLIHLKEFLLKDGPLNFSQLERKIFFQLGSIECPFNFQLGFELDTEVNPIYSDMVTGKLDSYKLYCSRFYMATKY